MLPVNSTILVKKADGTSVRMTMEEFRAYKSGLSSKMPNGFANQDKSIPTVSMSHETANMIQTDNEVANLPMEIQTEALATTAPVVNIFIDEAMANSHKPEAISYKQNLVKVEDQKIEEIRPKTEDLRFKTEDNEPKTEDLRFKIQDNKPKSEVRSPKSASAWTAEDHKSLLEEQLESNNQDLPFLPGKKDNEFNQVIRKIKFPIREEQLWQVKSLVVSRLKDVRTDEQIMDYCQRPEMSGGLGWNENQAKALVMAIRETDTTSAHHNLSASPAQNYGRTFDPQDQDTIRTNVSAARALNASLPSPEPAKKALAANEIMSLGYAEGQRPLPNTARPVLHDVKAPDVENNAPIGPIDEIKRFSVGDFRRLASTAQGSADVLQKKFLVLKKESYLLFLQALKAWAESPLYLQYQAVIRDALAENIKVAQLFLANKGQARQLKMEEFEALVELNSHLNT